MSEDYKFKILIDGNFSERFIGNLKVNEVSDAILSDMNFSDYCDEVLGLHWSDISFICRPIGDHPFNHLHENGIHSGNIVIEQNNIKIFDISIEDIMSDRADTITEMAPSGWDNGIYYLRIEWEGRGDIIQLEGEVDEDEREGWKDNFEYVFSPSHGDLGVMEGIDTYTNLGYIDLTEVDRPNPSGSDELFFSKGNVGGETKLVFGLTELISIMKKDNVDLLDKDKIMNYLNKFISE